MNDEATVTGLEESGRGPEKTRLTSVILRADVIRVAEQVARTEDRLAQTLRRLAYLQPHDAPRLRARISAAEGYAARMRSLASRLRTGSSDGDDSQAEQIGSNGESPAISAARRAPDAQPEPVPQPRQ